MCGLLTDPASKTLAFLHKAWDLVSKTIQSAVSPLARFLVAPLAQLLPASADTCYLDEIQVSPEDRLGPSLSFIQPTNQAGVCPFPLVSAI